MAYQIDQQFIKKFTFLVREVLSDEANFVSRNDRRFEKLHSLIFSKNAETPFANLPDGDKESFKKYFYTGETGGQPRQNVPFTDSVEAQAHFFDQFHQQVKNCTYNFSRMDLLRPSFSDDKATAPAFNDYQEKLLLGGVVYPMMHGLEQEQIRELEGKKGGTAETGQEKEAAAGNPYQNLGEKILVQGTSGQFDTVLSFAQLSEIAAEENLLRTQGLNEDRVVSLLKEFIAKRYPDLHIYISAEGKIVPFLRSAGISASGLPVPAGSETMSFSGLISEMKVRQGRKMQYDAISAGNGTLALSAQNYQVVDSTGVVTAMNGLTMGLDQEGQGGHAVFFVADVQGVGAKVVVNTEEYRIGGSTNFNFSIYASPDKDEPSNPKIRLDSPELPQLKTPLLALYRKLKEIGEYRIVPGRPIREFFTGTVKPPEVPIPAGPAGAPGERPAEGGPTEIGISEQKKEMEAQNQLRAAGEHIEAGGPAPNAPAAGVRPSKAPPKTTFERAPEYKPPVKRTEGTGEGGKAVPPARRPEVRPKVRADEQAGQNRKPSKPPKSRAGAIVTASIGLPIAAALGSALVKILST